MNRHKIRFSKYRIMMALGTILGLAVYGCATVSPSRGPQLPPAPLPTYHQGTTFVYADGRWETVTDIDQGMVTWTDDRNYVSKKSSDITYRSTNWTGKNRSVTRQFGPRTDLLLPSAASLWPLRSGNIVNYSETGTWVNKDGTESSYKTDWACAVEGTERVSVTAGDFDTYKIVCKRYYVSRKTNRSYLRDVKTWNYAPEVGHYVYATTRYRKAKAPRSRELLAVLPPLNAFSAAERHQLEQSFQQALERKKSGESVHWSSNELRASVVTTPTKTFRTPDGRYSRRYLQKITLPDGQRTYYGMAVRNSDGVWIIPRLR